MDNFKGQDNKEMKRFCAKNNCYWLEFHTISQRRNKFRPLDISINQSAKKFISSGFNVWYADRVSKQLSNRVAPCNLKVFLKCSDFKPLYVPWIVETYNHLKHQNDSVIKGFNAVGSARLIMRITRANDVFTKVESSFNKQRQQHNF